MKRETERHEWVVYVLTPQEFAEKLGIPERVVTVSTAGGKITIHANADKDSDG